MTKSRTESKEGKRRLSNAQIMMMIFILAVMTVAGIFSCERLKALAMNSRFFTLKSVSVEGNHKVSSADILSAASLDVGNQSIFSISPEVLALRIKSAFRYVDDVEVHRSLSLHDNVGMHGNLVISIKERQAVALVACEPAGDSCVALIDKRGNVLEEEKQFSDKHLPVIVKSGTETNEDGIMDVADAPEVGLGLSVLADIESTAPALFDHISRVDARNPDDILLYLGKNTESQMDTITSTCPNQSVHETAYGDIMLRFTSKQIMEALNRIKSVIMKRETENKRTTYIDARFPGALYCRGSEETK